MSDRLKTLTDLRERVQAATGPDRELDAEIMFDMFASAVGKKDDCGPLGYIWPDDNPSWNLGIRFPGKDRTWFSKTRTREERETLLIERDNALVLMNSLRVKNITSLLDDAIWLLNRVLPGWWWSIGTCCVSDDARIAPDYNDPAHGERLKREFPMPAERYLDPDEQRLTWGPFDEGFDVDRRPPGNVPLALLEAMLDALIYIEEQRLKSEAE